MPAAIDGRIMPHLRNMLVLGLGLSLALSACGEKPVPASVAEAPAAPTGDVKITDVAGKLGFAAHLPSSTEFYYGTIQLRKHLDALHQTSFWKDVSAFWDDKMPAPSKSGEKAKFDLNKELKGDVFMAGGKGTAATLAGWRELSEVYSEISYRGLMSGGSLGGETGPVGPQVNQMVRGLIEDAALLKRMSAAVSAIQLPPLLMGAQLEKPEALFETLITQEIQSDWVKKGAKITEVKTALGGQFKVISFQLSAFLTEEMQAQALAGIPEDIKAKNPESAAIVSKILDDLQAKPLVIAYGTVQGYAVISTGQDASHLQFAEAGGESLVARTEFSALAPYADKDLLFVASMDAAVLEAASSRRPMQPILRGLLAGLKTNDMFRDLATGLEPRIAMLGEAEEKLSKSTFTHAVAAGWWSEGLHIESFGGKLTPMLDETQPLSMGTLLDDPGLIAGINYRSTSTFAADSRTYVELWVEMAHHVTRELMQAGLGGDQGAQIAQMLDAQIIPELVKFYQASKAMDEKALGTEHAIVIDLGGKMADLPGLPPAAADKKMLRMAGVSPVKDRAAISAEWTRMEGSLKKMLAGAPLPMQIALPSPLSSDKNGATTYFYPIPFATEDLLPSASVSDQWFILGTSKKFAEQISSQLATAKADPSQTGLRWKVRFSNVRELIKTSSALSPDPDKAADMGQATKWLAPLGDLTGSSRSDKGARRDSLNWEILDVKKFD